MDVFMEEQEQLPSRGGLGNTEETAEAAGAAHDVRAELTPTARRVLSEMQVIEVIPYSSKVVVLDMELPINEAFHALAENSISAAPVWDSKLHQYVGMLTSNDFVRQLTILRQSPWRSNMTVDMSRMQIKNWKRVHYVRHEVAAQGLVSVFQEDNLLKAVETCIKQNVHYLPCLDSQTGSPLVIMTNRLILRRLNTAMNLGDATFDAPLSELVTAGLGTFGSTVITVSEETPVIQVLDLCRERHVQAIPVVDKANGYLCAMYSQQHVVSLARARMYSQLDLPVVEAMATPRAPDYLPVQTMLREKQAQRHKASVDTVNMATPLRDVMVKLASSAHHQLVCVSDGAANQQTVLGVITIDDFFSWLLKITVPVAGDGAGAGAEQATPVGS